MSIDVIVFAVIAAFLVYRLRSVLGTRHGDERNRPNPFSVAPLTKGPEVAPIPLSRKPARPAAINWEASQSFIVESKTKDALGDGVKEGLSEIAAADATFDIQDFIAGARSAFTMIVTSYVKGDRALLKSLLSETLYKDFSAGIAAREQAGRTSTIEVHRITSAKIIDARLAGVMAYITVDFDVEETTVTRDAAGQVVEGDPERISEVTDIWNFARDIRTADPNWILIETSTRDHK